MLRQVVTLLATLTAAHATGVFTVLHCPPSIKFKGEQGIDQSMLTEAFTAALGFTLKQKETWNGLTITELFSLPEAVVGIAVEGVNTLNTSMGKQFLLHVNEIEETTWQALSGRLEERDNDNMLVRIYLGDGVDALGQSALGELKPKPINESSLKVLDAKDKEVRKFLEEIELLHEIARKIPNATKPDNKPDVYWLVVSGLKPVYDLYGNNSAATNEALGLLSDAMDAVSKAFIKAYDDKVLITAFTNDATQVRHARSVGLNREKRAADDKKVPSNLSKDYSSNYPVIFNIFLWFGVAFFFSLLAICIAIADMDPGRDSIIYRMTSNRMKKDN